MRPLFTIHAGEYLVADYIESRLSEFIDMRVWVPSKDNSIDLLVTNEACGKTVSLQVKFSKTYDCETSYDASGWWWLKTAKIQVSPADFWVFVLPEYRGLRTFKNNFYFVVTPQELLRRLQAIHGVRNSYDMYLTVKGQIAIETRVLNKAPRLSLFAHPQGDRVFRDF